MLSTLSNFKLAKFAAIYQVGEQGLSLPPYKGSTFRGVFGHVFREVACTCSRDERGFVSNHSALCPYAFIFETAAQEGAELLHNYENIPRPFILEPPTEEKTFFAPGERFTLGFTLFGEGIHYLPYFVYVLEAIGRQGLGRDRNPVELRQIFTVDHYGDYHEQIYHAGERLVKNDFLIISGEKILSKGFEPTNSQKELSDIKYSKLEIFFTSPTRMKYDGRYISEPEFHIILRNIVRRVTALLYFYHEGLKLELDFQEYFEAAKQIKLVQTETEWIDWERYSSRQKERMKMGGITGKAMYAGDLTPYLSWLQLAEWINLGKNPVFGLGRIRVII